MAVTMGGPRFETPFQYSLPRLKKMFQETGLSQGWWETELPLVLAVSGGSDSIAMLWMFAQFRKRDLLVAHLDHGIRGQAGKKDADFVAEMAARFEIPLKTLALPVPELLRKGESLEDGARRIRYGFLEDIRSSVGGWGVSVAHTSDDAVETFLLNLLRGSGVRGLTGIPERRGYVFRPLLRFSREFLRDMLKCYQISWRDDVTNLDTAYLRNRIRNTLLPILTKNFNQRSKEHILGVAKDLAVLRRREEDVQASLFSLGKRNVPFSSYSSSVNFLQNLDDETMAIFLRGVATELKLKVLTRERTLKLIRLIRSSRKWCFQWQREMFVFCFPPFVSWIVPDILNKLNAPRSIISLEGGKGKFSWNGWLFSWKKEQTSFSSAGIMQAVLPAEKEIEIFPFSFYERKEDRIASLLEGFVFPLLRSGKVEWVPFWGKQWRWASKEKNIHSVRIVAEYCMKEKGKENGLQCL